MHRECVYKLWASINRPDLSYRRFPIVTLIEASRTLSHKQNTHKISNFIKSFYPVQHNFHTNLDKNIFRINA